MHPIEISFKVTLDLCCTIVFICILVVFINVIIILESIYVALFFFSFFFLLSNRILIFMFSSTPGFGRALLSVALVDCLGKAEAAPVCKETEK